MLVKREKMPKYLKLSLWSKQGRKRPLDTPKRMIEKRENEGKREKERQKERYREEGRERERGIERGKEG